MQCPNCGFESKSAGRFCGRCGRELSALDPDSGLPTKPGWYPDPWSATGSGERYFDGKAWGTSERPLGRHASTPASVTRTRPGRRNRTVYIVVVIALLAAAGWAIVNRLSPRSASSVATKVPPPATAARGRRGVAPRTSVVITTTTFTLQDRHYSRGDCVTWDQTPGADSRATSVVPCPQAHLLEISGSYDLTGFDHYPSLKEINFLFNSVCAKQVEALIGHQLDPDGKYVASGTYPTHDSWANGDRVLWCGAESHLLYKPQFSGQTAPFTGRVEGANQTALLPVGSCIPPGDYSYLVACSQPHLSEVTGYVDLTGAATQAPAANDSAGWDRLVGDKCQPIATHYLGHPPTGDLEASFLPIETASWNAGRRALECVVARFHNGNPVTMTGSLKG
jgi:hypothetical protein